MKKIVSTLLGIVMLFTCTVGMCPTVGATSSITCKITYSATTGAAYLKMTASDKANSIYYTADGTVPTTSSKLYTKKLQTSKCTVIRAAEFDADGNKVAGVKLTLRSKAAPVQFAESEKNGDYVVALTSATENAVIYYTTDGSAPTDSSSKYIDKLVVNQSCTIKAVAYADNLKKSAVKSLDVEISEKTETVAAASELVEPYFPEYMTNMLNYLNEERATAGVGALTLDAELCKAAAVRAEELTTFYSGDHIRPDGRKYSTVIDDLGIVLDVYDNDFERCTITGENIARGQETVGEVVRKWIASTDHRNNIVLSKFKKVGVAYLKSNDSYQYYWVQIFST